MGLSDFDDQIYAERDLLDWARQAPQRPGYDDVLTEEQRIAYKRDVLDHAKQRPSTDNGYGGDSR